MKVQGWIFFSARRFVLGSINLLSWLRWLAAGVENLQAPDMTQAGSFLILILYPVFCPNVAQS